MIMTIASWLCKCGTRVNVKAEVDRQRPITLTVPAHCPECGNEQSICAHRIVKVTGEREKN